MNNSTYMVAFYQNSLPILYISLQYPAWIEIPLDLFIKVKIKVVKIKVDEK